MKELVYKLSNPNFFLGLLLYAWSFALFYILKPALPNELEPLGFFMATNIVVIGLITIIWLSVMAIRMVLDALIDYREKYENNEL